MILSNVHLGVANQHQLFPGNGGRRRDGGGGDVGGGWDLQHGLDGWARLGHPLRHPHVDGGEGFDGDVGQVGATNTKLDVVPEGRVEKEILFAAA